MIIFQSGVELVELLRGSVRRALAILGTATRTPPEPRSHLTLGAEMVRRRRSVINHGLSLPT